MKSKYCLDKFLMCGNRLKPAYCGRMTKALQTGAP
uniref:Uncharacterized protein n=1 Tax=Anguilla anguilla TaxID=7936 RepID=A0A0E9QLK4_ANGAN